MFLIFPNEASQVLKSLNIMKSDVVTVVIALEDVEHCPRKPRGFEFRLCSINTTACTYSYVKYMKDEMVCICEPRYFLYQNET